MGIMGVMGGMGVVGVMGVIRVIRVITRLIGLLGAGNKKGLCSYPTTVEQRPQKRFRANRFITSLPSGERWRDSACSVDDILLQ